jgi:hypothetical protein
MGDNVVYVLQSDSATDAVFEPTGKTRPVHRFGGEPSGLILTAKGPIVGIHPWQKGGDYE